MHGILGVSAVREFETVSRLNDQRGYFVAFVSLAKFIVDFVRNNCAGCLIVVTTSVDELWN